jgi:hypothetical protein
VGSRYRFNGHAIGAAGRINNPFQEIIEIQAAAALPEIGGYGTARSNNFRYREILQFEAAHSEVTGSKSNGNSAEVYNSLIKSTVEGLNIMGMVTADRVVANLVSVHDGGPDSEPSIKLAGSRFENLRIAGVPVKVDLCLDIFDGLHTHQQVLDAYRTKNEFRTLFDSLTLKHKLNEAPSRVQRLFYKPAADDAQMPHTKGITSVSLVRKLEPERPPEYKCYGHVIYVEGFGTIQLAELLLSKQTRRLTMIQVNLGSPVEGDLMAVAADDGGSPF